MKFALPLLFLITFSSVQAQSNIDVLHYKYSIELNDENDTIYGRADITVKFLESATRLEFDFVQPDKEGKQCR